MNSLTALALDLALSVAYGLPWLEKETSSGRVLIVNLELSDWTIRSRLKEIAWSRGIQTTPGKVIVWNLRGFVIPPEKLRFEIAQRKPDDLALVIVDPAYKLLQGRDENSASDVANLLSSFEGITKDTGAAVVVPAHFAKGNAAGKEAMDRISGSGVFARDPDTLITLTKHEAEDSFTVESILRTFPPEPPFVIRRQHPIFTVDRLLDPERLKKAPGRPGAESKYPPEKLMALLPSEGMEKPAWCQKAKRLTGVSSSTFYRICDTLEESRQITCTLEGFCKPRQRKGRSDCED